MLCQTFKMQYYKDDYDPFVALENKIMKEYGPLRVKHYKWLWWWKGLYRQKLFAVDNG